MGTVRGRTSRQIVIELRHALGPLFLTLDAILQVAKVNVHMQALAEDADSPIPDALECRAKVKELLNELQTEAIMIELDKGREI